MDAIEALITQLTLEEKAALCIGKNAWTTTPIDRLGVPAMLVSDGPHGVRRVPDLNTLATQSLPATCFPSAACLASTWDTDLVHCIGQALGEEAAALKVDALLGPGCNMKRSPLGGRNFEYFSEDPYLAGEMAASLINGIQSRGVGTSLKHYAANNQEFQRFSINAIVDERTLREIYLPAFETAVKKAQPWTVMCAYNRLNSTSCSQHHILLTEILRDEWGFEGFVISDWGAVRDRVAALQAGLDLEMPGPKPRRAQAIVDAVRAGTLDESVLNKTVRRILTTVFKAAATPKGGQFDVNAHHALAQQAAAEGIILLKNNGILPLKQQTHIAVIGRAAAEPRFQGGGSSQINPTRVAVPFKELQPRAGEAELVYAEGYPADDSSRPELIAEAARVAQGADVALLFMALPAEKESEGYDRADLDLTPQQVALIKAVTAVQPQTVVILNNGAPVDMRAWLDGTAAVLEGLMLGQAGGAALADVLFGRSNPCGKLAETFPLKLADTPAHINFPGGNGEVRYGEGIYIGYRYYDAKEAPVLFPFGHGLSYTTFAYSALKVSATTFRDIDGVTVSVDVTNTGAVAGKEIVQVYVHDQQADLARPPKELKGFAKIELQPGETKTVSVSLNFRAFAYYHPAYKQWITESGVFDILVGASAADIRCSQTVTLQSTLELPCRLKRESTLREWLADPRGQVVLKPLFSQIIALMSQVMGGKAEYDSAVMGMDLTGMLMDMPLVSILHFNENSFPQLPEEQVDSWLAQAYALEHRP